MIANDSGVGVFLDPHWGVIQQLSLESPPPWEPQVHIGSASLSRGLRVDGADTRRQQWASGAHVERDRALAATLGEAFERTFGGVSEFVQGDVAVMDLPPACLDSLPTWSVEERHVLSNTASYSELDPASIAEWMPATDAFDGSVYRLPAQLVFCPYHPPNGEARFWEPTTTGLGCGDTIENALLGGLFEVLERDAVAASWLLGIPGRTMGLEAPDELYLLHRGNISARLALVTLDIAVPICVAALLDAMDRPLVAFGSAAAPTIREAVRKALCEAALARYTLKLRLATVDEPLPDLDKYEPATYQDHGLAWAVAPGTSEWLFDSRDTDAADLTSAGAVTDVWRTVLGLVRAAGYHVYWVDLTSPELRQIGKFVVRVVVPGLQPLNPGRHRTMADSPRLDRLAAIYGSRGARNPLIHPFC